MMKDLLYQHLVSCSISKDDVVKAVVEDEELLFNWDLLSGQLSTETSQLLLKEITDFWMTICGHALAKQLTEQHKQYTGKDECKSKSLRQELKRGL